VIDSLNQPHHPCFELEASLSRAAINIRF